MRSSYSTGAFSSSSSFVQKAASYVVGAIPLAVVAGMAVMTFQVAAPPETLSEIAAASTEGIKTKTLVITKAHIRTKPFSQAGTVWQEGTLQPIEIVRHEKPDLEWSIVQAGAAALCDVESCTVYHTCPDGSISSGNLPSICFSQISFASSFLWGRDLLDLETNMARIRQSPVTIEHQTAPDGEETVVVKIGAAEKIPGFLLPVPGELKWFDPELHKVYTFSAKTYRMKSAKVYVLEDGKQNVVFETESINYKAIL